MNGSRRVAPAVCALLLLAGGCARNPVSGRAQATLVSEAKERELTEAGARKVTETMGIYDDAALSDYVRAVGERLARVSPRQGVSYTFQVVGMQEPNAFAPWRRVGWGWKAVASAGAGKLRTRGDERMRQGLIYGHSVNSPV